MGLLSRVATLQDAPPSRADVQDPDSRSAGINHGPERPERAQRPQPLPSPSGGARPKRTTPGRSIAKAGGARRAKSNPGGSAAGRSAGITDAPKPAKPDTCPVVGLAVCYYDGCRHWSGAACAHPSVVSAPRRGGNRNKPGSRRKGSAARIRG